MFQHPLDRAQGRSDGPASLPSIREYNSVARIEEVDRHFGEDVHRCPYEGWFVAVINVNDTSANDLCCSVAGFQFVSGCVDRFDRDSQGRHARKLVLPDESFAQ